MRVITDPIELSRVLGAFAYDPATASDPAARLQTMPGSAIDTTFRARKIIYAFPDCASTAGIEMLGQLAAFSMAQNSEVPGQPGRIDSYHKAVLRDLGAPGEHPLPQNDP